MRQNNLPAAALQTFGDVRAHILTAFADHVLVDYLFDLQSVQFSHVPVGMVVGSYFTPVYVRDRCLKKTHTHTHTHFLF